MRVMPVSVVPAAKYYTRRKEYDFRQLVEDAKKKALLRPSV